MDENTNKFTLNDFITQYQTVPICFTTIYLLTDKSNKFVITIYWEESEGSQFKMFKQLAKSDVIAFCLLLSDQYNDWYEKICQWLHKPSIPLKLNNRKT